MILLFSWCPFEFLDTSLSKASALFHGHKMSLLHNCRTLYCITALLIQSFSCKCSEIVLPGQLYICIFHSSGNAQLPIWNSTWAGFEAVFSLPGVSLYVVAVFSIAWHEIFENHGTYRTAAAHIYNKYKISCKCQAVLHPLAILIFWKILNWQVIKLIFQILDQNFKYFLQSVHAYLCQQNCKPRMLGERSTDTKYEAMCVHINLSELYIKTMGPYL